MSTTGRGIVYGKKMTSTGILAPKREKESKFYPNPTNNMLYCRETAKLIEILGLNGEKILETNQSQISVGCLQNGCYIARLHTTEGVYNQIFLIKK